MKYTSVKQDAIPFEVLCIEINARLKVLQYAIQHHLNGVTLEDLFIDLDGKQVIFPLEIFPGNVGPLTLGPEYVASLRGLTAEKDSEPIGVAVTQNDFDNLLEALRALSEKYHLTVALQKATKIRKGK